ncbi:MAG: hypothetical protein PHU56_04225 [Candidatus Pacebacteria bacterium]|nr:hypothetical protein [Candidatus Paceibacterota bacterium]
MKTKFREPLNRFDSQGQKIFSDDIVEVVREEGVRAGLPDYDYCSIGKWGVVVEEGCWSTGINVSFPVDKNGKRHHTVGCEASNLKKVSQ